MKEHPIPSDKGKYGTFEKLSIENKRLIQQILSEDSSSIYHAAGLAEGAEDPYDVLVLEKLRGLYGSCMDEDLLDARGQEPLLHVVRNIRKLFSGESTSVDSQPRSDSKESKDKYKKGLTASLAYVHSRGNWTGSIGSTPPDHPHRHQRSFRHRH